MKTSIKTIGLLAALALGLTSPLFAQVPDLTKDTQSERVAAVSKLLSKTDPLPSLLLDAQFIEEQAGASAGAVKSRTFNVLNYGAVGDDKTDNTEAFSACLKAVIAAGGGKMFIPDGIYRGRIIIPGTKEWITVEIAGESEPTPVWGTIGTFAFPKNGTIIKCLSESGPAVISSASVPDKLYGQFSGVNVSLRNLDVLPGAMPKDWPSNPAKHRVVITRAAKDDKESAMIAAAEAAQPSKEKLREAAEARDRNDPLGLAQPKGAKAPVGDNVWWYKEQLGIRIPCAITADAVAYYSDLVGKYGKQVLKRYIEPSSRLDYHAGVAFHKEFKLDDKTFNNVHVVTLKLTFDQNFAATTTEGMHFEKKRVVVLDGKGKVLHISGDGPTEVPILAI